MSDILQVCECEKTVKLDDMRRCHECIVLLCKDHFSDHKSDEYCDGCMKYDCRNVAN